jgi:hypothetical protein
MGKRQTHDIAHMDATELANKLRSVLVNSKINLPSHHATIATFT